MRRTGPHYSMDQQESFQRSGNILVTALGVGSIIWFMQVCLRRRAAILSRESHRSKLILGGIQDQVPVFRLARISIGPVVFNCGGNSIRLRGPCPSPVMRRPTANRNDNNISIAQLLLYSGTPALQTSFDSCCNRGETDRIESIVCMLITSSVRLRNALLLAVYPVLSLATGY